MGSRSCDPLLDGLRLLHPAPGRGRPRRRGRRSRPAGAVRGRALGGGLSRLPPRAAAGAADRRGGEPEAGPGLDLLRAPRRRGRGAGRDLEQRARPARAPRGRASRRRRGRDRRRARLLPGHRDRLAELQPARHLHPARRRGRPARPARPGAPAARRRRAAQAAEGTPAAAAAADDRRRQRPRLRRLRRPARRARAPRLARDPGLGERPGPEPARGAGDRPGAGRPRRGRGRSRSRSSVAAAAASPTCGRSATRTSAARWRCCGCR